MDLKLISFLRSFFSKLKMLFLSPPVEADEGYFPTIDPDKIKAELRIVEQARAQGAVGVPDALDTRLTETEHQIVGTVGSLRAATFKSGQGWLKVIQQRLDTIDLTQQRNRTIQLGEEFERKADSILSKRDGELQDLLRNAKATKAELDAFRVENRRSEAAPKMLEWNGYAVKVAILAGCCMLESVINASFFASGMVGGLLAGVTMALCLALINILGAFFIGRLTTNINHVQPTRRLVGYLLLLFAVLWTCAIGGLVAYCRFVMPQIQDETVGDLHLIWQNISTLTNPFDSLESIALFIVTVVFGLIALVDGYKWSDPYPGYSKIYKQHFEKFQDLLGLIHELQAELEELKEETLNEIEVNVKTAKDAVNRFRSSMGEKSVAKKKVTQHLILADNTMRALTQAYRYENQMVRPVDKPRPAYFNDELVLDFEPFPDFGIEKDEARLAVQGELLQEMLSILEPTRKKVQSAFTQKFDQLKPLQGQI
ncbi:hypothetical protein ACW9I8_04510 [Pseudomonas reactans]